LFIIFKELFIIVIYHNNQFFINTLGHLQSIVEFFLQTLNNTLIKKWYIGLAYIIKRSCKVYWYNSRMGFNQNGF